MADVKVSGLTAATAVTADDLLLIVDDPGGTPVSKKVTALNLFKSVTQPFGSFSSSANQTVANATTAYAVAFNTDDLKSGITHSTVTNNSQIQIDTAGTYEIIISAIADLTSGANKHLDIWLAVDGSAVARSNTRVELPVASIEMTVAVSLMYTFTAGQYFEIMYCSDSTDMRMLATGTASNPTRPACPSVICTVKRISG